MIRLSKLVCFYVFFSHALVAADPLLKYKQGRAAFEAGRYADAQTLFNQFAKENPYEPEVRETLYYLARISATGGKYHEAIARANIALERHPMHPNRPELLVITGECLYHVEAHAKAEKTLLSAARIVKSDDLKYRIEKTLGFIAHEGRRREKAATHMKAALRYASRLKIKDKDTYKIYRDLGKIYATDPLQTEAAVRYLQSAIEMAEAEKLHEASTLKLLLRKVSMRRIDKFNGLPDDTIADIRVDGDDVYVATWGGGLIRYLRSQNKLEKLRLPSSQLRGLYIDFDEIFVTSYDGVYRVSKKTGEVSPLSDESGALRLGQKTIKDDRYIYFSTLNRGLIQYDTIKRKVVTLGKSSWVGSDQVYALDADVEYLVVGTIDHGAIIYNKKTGEATRIAVNPDDANGLRSNNVKAVLLDGRYVYLGTHNDGVYVYDMQAKKLKRLNIEAPFPSAFARREHEIFIGTSGQGIRVLNRNTNSIEKLTAIEGLSSNEVQILRIEGDFVWVGYLEKGIDVVYRPQADK
jgi:tetratricopeptide (TPR) repeat protein